MNFIEVNLTFDFNSAYILCTNIGSCHHLIQQVNGQVGIEKSLGRKINVTAIYRFTINIRKTSYTFMT